MMKTNPEMNAKIVGILRTSDAPHCLYAAQRIEELEAIVDCQDAQLLIARTGLVMCGQSGFIEKIDQVESAKAAEGE